MMKIFLFFLMWAAIAECYSQINSEYFQNVKANYDEYRACGSHFKKRKANYPLTIIRTQSDDDTLRYKFDFYGIHNKHVDGLLTMVSSDEFLLLKVVKQRWYLDYDSVVVKYFKGLNLKKSKFMDLTSNINDCVEAKDYFFYDRMRVCLKLKFYDSIANDTIYSFKINGHAGVGHMALLNGFFFSKKCGFLLWELGIEDTQCRLFLIDKSFKRKRAEELILKMISCGS